MRISPIGLDGCGSCYFQPVVDLLRPQETSIFDDINNEPPIETDPAKRLFNTINRLNENAYGPRDKIVRDPNTVLTWLQYPNDVIRDLADRIVILSDSDDVKMEKIQRWVVDHIEYMTDEAQYGYEELWVPPVMVLKTGKGDCEDGAFLIMSLGLNAGVDPDRLRMYGGFVDAGPGAASGGHGWVAYRRESDNEWVALDFSYYPDLRPMEFRTPLRADEKYVDDYFFINNQYTVSTENTNRIRDPEIYFPDGGLIPNVLFPAGSLLNAYA